MVDRRNYAVGIIVCVLILCGTQSRIVFSAESDKVVVKETSLMESFEKTLAENKKLEKEKTIWGYSAIIDDEKFGLKKYFVLLKRKFNHISKDKVDKILKRSLKKEAVKIGIYIESSYFIYGSFDWLLCINAKNIKHVKKFCSLLINLFGEDNISDMDIHEVVFPVEKNNIFLLNHDFFLFFCVYKF